MEYYRRVLGVVGRERLTEILDKNATTIQEVLSKDHRYHVVAARREIMQIMREAGYSTPLIGMLLNVHPSTVHHHLYYR
jgi:hypothetical protein